MTVPLAAHVEGVGLLGPGLPSWTASSATLRGEAPHVFELSTLPPPPRLPPAERRRAGPVIRLAMAVAEEAVAAAAADPATLPTVFASSGGEGANCHSLCETLASPNPLISPTRFTNSVHNAAAGYWHIAVGSRAASTSLCAHDGSFGAGLIQAATLLATRGEPLLLVAYDLPYPEPLHSVRPLVDNFGLAMVLSPVPTPRTVATLAVELVAEDRAGAVSPCPDASLESLRRGIPAAAALPLLQAMARGARAGTLVIDYLPRVKLHVAVAPGGLGMNGAPATLDQSGIAARIPHAGRMCLLARLEAWDASRIACVATGHSDADHPLRTRSGLLAPAAIEYAAQAMALHGALIGESAGDEAGAARPGYLASVRGVRFSRLRLDDLGGELVVEAERQAGDARQILYRFAVAHGGETVAEGRAAVVLNTPLAGGAPA